MDMDLLLGFIIAMTVTMALIPPLMRLAGRARMLDQPETRKVHAAPIPRVGGIAMSIGVLLALALLGHFDRSLQAFCAGILVLLVFGIWDDRVTLTAGPKFLGQVIAVLIAMTWGGVSVASITVADRVPLESWLACPLTFFFLIGATNAINLSDGLDGLAGGMTLLCLGALALMAFTIGNSFVGPVALVTAGSILGFLRFNTHPARVFMGDCGSQVLGFSVAVLSVALTQDPQAPLSAALPLLLLGVPVMDTLTVMTERVLSGRSPFKADRTHLHHRLLAMGFRHHEAVMVIYALQALLFVAAWFLRYSPDWTVVLAYAAFAVAVIATMRVARLRAWTVRVQGAGLENLPNHEATAASRQILRRRAYRAGQAIAAALILYGLVVVIRPSHGGHETELLASVSILLATNLALRWRSDAANWLDRAGLYVSAVVAVYLDNHSANSAGLHVFKLLLFLLLAVAIVLRLRWSADRQFTVNPLDLLVVFMAIAVPNLPGSMIGSQEIGAAAAKLLPLLYGIEALSNDYSARWRLLTVGVLGFLIACLLRGA